MVRKKEILVPLLFFALALLSYFLFDDISPLTGNGFLDAIMQGISTLGGFMPLALVGVLLLAYGLVWKKNEWKKQGFFFLFVYLLDSALIVLLKEAIGRERPIPGIETTKSFPSGHAARTMLAARIFGTWYPRLCIFLWVFSFTVGFSRIYLGVHYISDVLAGFGISYLTGTLYLWFYDAFILRTRQKSS